VVPPLLTWEQSQRHVDRARGEQQPVCCEYSRSFLPNSQVPAPPQHSILPSTNPHHTAGPPASVHATTGTCRLTQFQRRSVTCAQVLHMHANFPRGQAMQKFDNSRLRSSTHQGSDCASGTDRCPPAAPAAPGSPTAQTSVDPLVRTNPDALNTCRAAAPAAAPQWQGQDML